MDILPIDIQRIIIKDIKSSINFDLNTFIDGDKIYISLWNMWQGPPLNMKLWGAFLDIIIFYKKINKIYIDCYYLFNITTQNSIFDSHEIVTEDIFNYTMNHINKIHQKIIIFDYNKF